MRLPDTSYRIVAVITIVVSVIGLVMSPVSAATQSFPSGDPAGTSAGNIAYHHAFNSTQQTARLQAVLANLSQQGVDVSMAQADLTAGNVTAAVQWLMAYHNDHPDLALNGPRQHVVNVTAQTARLQSVLANLTQQGMDISTAQADLAAGNITGAMRDLMVLHKHNPGMNHPGMRANSTQLAARFQNGVTKLAQQGVDVSGVQADLASGNMNAAMQWMATYHKEHPIQNGNGTARSTGNSTQWQQGSAFQLHHTGSGNQTTSHQWSSSGTRHTQAEHTAGA